MERDVDGVAVDACPFGHGVWLDSGEFEQVVAAARVDRETMVKRLAGRAGDSTVRHELRAKERPCPVCDEMMDLRVHAEWSEVVLDHCDAHGIWFDADELERAVAWELSRREPAAAGVAAHGAALEMQQLARQSEGEKRSFAAKLLALLRPLRERAGK